jgi:hypothetical protein
MVSKAREVFDGNREIDEIEALSGAHDGWSATC